MTRILFQQVQRIPCALSVCLNTFYFQQAPSKTSLKMDTVPQDFVHSDSNGQGIDLDLEMAKLNEAQASAPVSIEGKQRKQETCKTSTSMVGQKLRLLICDPPSPNKA